MLRRRGLQLRWLKRRANKDGSVRVYVCPPGGSPVRLPNLPEDDPDFLSAYAAAVREARTATRSAAAPGTLSALASAYLSSRAWRALRPSSQEQRGREIRRLVAKAGKVQVTAITSRHVRADLSELTPGAASNRLGAWRALLAHAVADGDIDVDPTHAVSGPPRKVTGHHSWTTEEIAAFRRHWAPGTEQRLVFELGYWSGARRSDLVCLGRQNITPDGWLVYRQVKTRGEVCVPFATLPAGCDDLSSDHAMLVTSMQIATRRMMFVATRHGSPRSAKAIGMWFRRACNLAGLPDRCTLHGLRKARARALAELGWSEGQIAAWTGHQTLSEVAHYTRAASRRRMIETALRRGPTGEETEQKSERVPDGNGNADKKRREIK